ncbi:MAG: HAMP domain-containing sensor histidine kinase [Peptostreptococcales bacterium]
MKINLDYKSLKFKLWLSFALFAALLMVILWFLQIFFLKTYYQEMKIAETKRIADTIKNNYGDRDFIDRVADITERNDMFIHIETDDGTIVFSPIEERHPHTSFRFVKEMSLVYKRLENSTEKTVSFMMHDPRTNTNTLSYATYLESTPDREVILYIFSPLYPVESTVDILSNQLVYVTIISLILAFVLSYFISKRITRPIIKITNTAARLADGDYDVSFEGGNYSEIIGLADTLNYTSEELAKTDNLQKDLIANVSHDLRTPLTMIKSYAEMIRDLSGDNSEKRNNHLKVVIDETDRLSLIVSDLLLLSRMQSGVETLNIKIFDLKERILSILPLYEIYKEREGFQIEFSCEADILVKGDEFRIKQVIVNFLDNSIRYSGENKWIWLSLTEKDGRIRFEIKDQGQGIPEEDLAHIWGKYYKSSVNHSRNPNGTGLGLSIAKEILELHEAEYGVQSKEGEGSIFWFELKKA